MKTFPARLAVPALLAVIWLAWSAWGGQTFGQISEVTTSDQAAFLPVDAESTRAQVLQERFTDSDAVPATVVAATSEGGELSAEGQAEAEALTDEISALPSVEQVIPPQPAEDGSALQILVLLEESGTEDGTLDDLRALVAEGLPEDRWDAGGTGPAALSGDFAEAFAGIATGSCCWWLSPRSSSF